MSSLRHALLGATILAASATSALPASAATVASPAQNLVDFSIPPQNLGSALNQLAQQANVRIAFPAEVVAKHRASGLKGRMTAVEAARRLVEPIHLKVIESSNGSIMVVQNASAASQAEQGGKGTVAGQVVNPATGEYLRDAIVEVVAADGDRTTTTSGDSGEYRLRDLPAGPARVTVRFTGYADETADVQIRPDRIAKLDFSLYEAGRDNRAKDSEIVVVGGVREGDAQAIMQQRRSMDITEVLSADSYGDIGDGNPAEFLKYMPGVDTDGTNGTAINVYLRGLPQDYTTVTLNGMNLVSADANTGAGSARVFSFEAMSLAGIDSIEISKTTSADVDANAPAGTINIRTKRAFDRKRGLLTVQLSGATHEDMWDGKTGTGPQDGGWGRKRFLPNGQISYANSFFDHRLGVMASIGKTDTYIEREQITLSRNYVPTAKSPDPLGITAIAPEAEGRETQRLSATLSLDFKATDNLVLSVMGMASRGSVYQSDITPTYTTGIRSAGVAGDPYYDFTTQQSATAKTLATTSSTQFKVNNGNFVAPSFEWNHKNVKLDGYFVYSDATSYYDTPQRGEVVTMTSALSSVGNFSAQRAGSLKDADWDITQTSGKDWSNPDSYTLAGTPTIRTTNGSTAETYLKAGAMNLTYDSVFGGVPVEFKTGFKIADAIYKFDDTSGNNLYAYTGPMTNAEFLRAVQSSSQLSYGDSGGSISTLSGSDYLYTPSLAKLYQMYRQNPGEWQHTLTAANWYAANVANKSHYEENTKAVYLMGTAELTRKLKVRAGVRWEHTGTTTLGFDPLSAGAVESAGYAVSASTGRATTIEGLQYQYLTNPMAAREADYSFFFPSASLKYEFDHQTQLQLGYSRTILRPEPDVLSGVMVVDEVNQTVSQPNPGLKPAISDNFSARLARYFEPVGIVAVGVYMNRVKGLFQQQELTAQDVGYTGTDYADYTFITTTTVPGNAVNIKGVEVEFNHSMNYLPKPFDKLSIRGSFMYNHPDIPVVRVADKIATFSLSWSGGPVKLYLNSVWTGDKYRSTTPSWFDDRLDMSLSGSYRFYRHRRNSVETFFSISNLLNKSVNVIVPGSLAKTGTLADHTAIYVHNGRNGTFGIRARF